jgi:hypothetical protein
LILGLPALEMNGLSLMIITSRVLAIILIGMTFMMSQGGRRYEKNLYNVTCFIFD